MEKVKCDHCGREIDKKDAVPCTWKEIDTTWYYCKPCNTGVFGMGIGKLKISNKKAIDNIKSMDKPKSFSIQGKSPNLAVLDELYTIKGLNEINVNDTKNIDAISLLKYIYTCDALGHDWVRIEGARVTKCRRCNLKAARSAASMDMKNRRTK